MFGCFFLLFCLGRFDFLEEFVLYIYGLDFFVLVRGGVKLYLKDVVDLRMLFVCFIILNCGFVFFDVVIFVDCFVWCRKLLFLKLRLIEIW